MKRADPTLMTPMEAARLAGLSADDARDLSNEIL
jgi:hypothetical protein